MATLTDELPAARKHFSAWGHLPSHLHALLIAATSRRSEQLTSALAADGASRVDLDFAAGSTEGAARLREEAFDAVLIVHGEDEVDALELVEALRAAGCEEPMIVLGTEIEAEFAPLCFEIGADAYVAIDAATTRHLIWAIARAVERHLMRTEVEHLRQINEKRLHQEHDEAARLIDQQRALVHDLEVLAAPNESGETESQSSHKSLAQQAIHASDDACLDPAVVGHYRELLRAYVIMGSGNLANEMGTLTGRLADAGVTAQETLRLHVQVLEELVNGLGTRSARHVMNRADLLVLEVMIHLAEGYRQLDRKRQPAQYQQLLPGFPSSRRAPCPPAASSNE